MSSSENFVEDAFSEIPEMVKATLDADLRVKSLLSGQVDSFELLKYGDTEIRFKTYLSKKLRHSISRVRTQLDASTDENTISIVEKTMYEILGQLCIDEPFNKWETWAYIDEKSTKGGVQGIFIEIMSKISKSVDDVRTFRNK